MNVDDIDRIFQQVDRVIELKRQQLELMHRLRQSLIHEIGERHLRDPRARARYQAELDELRVPLNKDSGRVPGHLRWKYGGKADRAEYMARRLRETQEEGAETVGP